MASGMEGTSTGHVITRRLIFIGANLQWSAKGIRISTCGFVLEDARRDHGTLPPWRSATLDTRNGMLELEIYLHRRERMEQGLMLQTAEHHGQERE